MCLFGVVGYRCIHSNFIVVAVTLDLQVRRSFYIMDTATKGNPVVDQSNLFFFFFLYKKKLSKFYFARGIFRTDKNNICLTRDEGRERLVGRGGAIKTNGANDCVQSVFLKDFPRDNRRCETGVGKVGKENV